MTGLRGTSGGICLLLLILPGGAVGCGGHGPYIKDGADPNSAFVFLSVDMSEAHCGLDYFQVKQVLPKVNKPYIHFRTELGIAYQEDLPLGSFQVSSLGGGGRHFYFPAQSEGIRIEEPGFYFLGSFKVRRAPSTGGKSELIAVEDPTQAQVLSMILPYAKGTEWAAKIRDRIKTLEGK